MSDNSPIFTNHSLKKMAAWNLSESDILDVLNNGESEKSSYGGKWNAIRKYNGCEVGINYDRKPDGRYIIISVWKRARR